MVTRLRPAVLLASMSRSARRMTASGAGDHADHPIADDVVVPIVYLLEVVNVHEQDTDPPPVAVLLVETRHELLLEEAPVPDLRERVEKGELSEFLVKVGHCR
jgi:hypothetical protein